MRPVARKNKGGNRQTDIMIPIPLVCREVKKQNNFTATPTMELHKYVQFVTMFRNSFNKTINDPVALYEISMRNVKGLAKRAIESCIFSDPSVDRYEEAMQILKQDTDKKRC